MYSGSFYPFTGRTPGLLEPLYLCISLYGCARQIYQSLFRLVLNKNYFVLTTNGIISSRQPALISAACFIPRETTAFCNAAFPVIKKPMTMNIPSIASCCISTGVFHIPQEKAAQIAIDTVERFLETGTAIRQVIFNVFTGRDFMLYDLSKAADKGH